MPTLIRPAVDSDATLSPDVPGEYLHRLVAVDDQSQVVMGEIFVVAGDDPKALNLVALYVMPEHRRKEVAAKLIESAEQTSRAHGAVATIAIPPEATDALQLMRRLRWVPVKSPNATVFVKPAANEVASKQNWRIETTAVHAGIPEEEFGPVTPIIGLSTTYRVTHPGTYGRFAYARSANPTRAALEEALTELEGGLGAGAFSSGLAAIDAVLRFLEPGQRLVVSNDVYGGTWRLFSTLWNKIGVSVDPVDVTDLDVTRKALVGSHMLIVETPSNPLLRVLDIPALAEAAHANGALFVVDNTFATPHLQRPLELGADFVTHSSSKYLGGHTDVIGGALVARDSAHVERIKYLQRAAGAVQSPFDSFLVLRGIRTLAVRMDRCCESATVVAETLRDHEAVEHVYFPGLSDDAGYELAQKQMRGPGGMVSFLHRGGAQAARRMSQRARLFTLAESLGAVESLIEVPAAMTHAISTGSLLEVPDNLVRLSVGIEHVDDILDDLRQALEE